MAAPTRIRFAPDILRRLGEELNPHPAAGIIELVKNSYDADARHCTVTLEGTDDVGGTIEVVDDGDGMVPKQIENGWLVLGRSQKVKRRRTRLNRIPAGSKGLGRLAALRLGRYAKLETCPRLQDELYRLIIDWRLFDSVSLIDDVALEIEELDKPPTRKRGTTVRLDKLRDRIGRLEVKRLARQMLLLADPFGDDREGFQPRLVAPEFSDLEQLVERRYFEHAQYHLVASVGSNGKALAKVLDFRGAELFSANHKELFPAEDKSIVECPPITFDLWAFILNKTSFEASSVTLKEVRNWLSEFGGVHIYQNGIRVAPYGDSSIDWLGMNLSRVRSPEERPSTNNSIGRIKVDDEDEVLIQKTDRSGFLESDAFAEIRRFSTAALDWMASRRLERAEALRAKARVVAPKRSKKRKEELEAAIATAPPKVRKQIEEAAEAYDRSREKEVSELRKEIQLYRTLSTAGITAATFAHESTGNPIKVIQTSINTIDRRVQEFKPQEYERLKKPIQRIVASVSSLSVLDTATLSLLDHEKRRVSRVGIHDVILNVLKLFAPFLTGRGVQVIKEFADGSPYFMGSEAALESIVTNLINNSLVALEPVQQDKRRILIRTVVNGATAILSLLDSGTGIHGIRLNDIWLPGSTTRKNGTGLGLTIVRDTVVDLGGTVDANEMGDLGGAEIIIELPIIGV
jgi:signal transduction histidine kinase